MRNRAGMSLTDDLVRKSLRVEIDPGPERNATPINDIEVEHLSHRLLLECGDKPLWVFAYGSLIWKPDFDAVDSRLAAAYGWHRSLCLEMKRRRGSRTQPGLMMALDRGGRCNGVIFRLADDNRLDQIRRMVRREVGSLEDARTIRWLTVQTSEGPVRALTFWVGPRGVRVRRKLPLGVVAGILARACGHMGSCAEYLHLTVKHLEERGIRDRNLWHLQKLVAAELRTIHTLAPRHDSSLNNSDFSNGG